MNNCAAYKDGKPSGIEIFIISPKFFVIKEYIVLHRPKFACIGAIQTDQLSIIPSSFQISLLKISNKISFLNSEKSPYFGE